MADKRSALEADLSRPENIGAVFDQCETALASVDILVKNHTHCAKDTFDPAAVTNEDFGIAFFSSAVADKHFVVNARSYALMMSEYIRRYLGRRANWAASYICLVRGICGSLIRPEATGAQVGNWLQAISHTRAYTSS
jgi:NAD(P)-dependent dehydrogenase (short-subunit alcohol dehydrogenase family)